MRFCVVLLFLIINQRVIAPDVKSLMVVETSPVDVYERLMMAILQVESGGDTLAFNALEEAYGPFQIRPIRLTDYNIRTGKKYVMEDCYRMSISREVFLYYAIRIGADYELIAKRWNGSGVKTIEYWSKVKAKLLDQETGLIPMKMPS
ncbi:MAG TPA: hypothetical protein VHO50_03200 [Bacteroidales bacterium]|nr:hypothetical protein [Bacteroidales bacterium]